MKRRMPSIPAPALGIFCLAFMVRVVYNLTVANHYVAGYDSQAYESIALHIINEHCFCKDPFIPTIGRAPLWPGIIAAIYTMTGYHNLDRGNDPRPEWRTSNRRYKRIFA